MSHHFHPFSVAQSTARSGSSWKVTYTSTETGKKISMRIPSTGVFDNPDSHHRLKKREVIALAAEIAEVLERRLAE